MLKKLLIAGGSSFVLISGAYAQDNAASQSSSTVTKGVHIVSQKGKNGEDEICIHINHDAGPQSKNCKKGKSSSVNITSSPYRCPITPPACVQNSGSLYYVYCTHTGGGAIHMDMYSGGTSGEYLGRYEDVGSLPPGCTNFIPVSAELKHKAEQHEQPVSCTGTCNFNYYAK